MGFEIKEDILTKYHEEKGITDVTIPDGVTEIGREAFMSCTSLESITIPDSVKEIGEEAFRRCVNLISITIPDGVTEISRLAFYDCKSLKEITIPDSVTEISRLAFGYCTSLESITIPDSVKEIGREAFHGCESLKEIKIQDGVTEISSGAFISCGSLESIIIPGSVTEIGENAFVLCKKLKEIKIRYCSRIITFDRESFIDFQNITKDGERVFEFLNADDDRREEIFPEIKKTGVKIMLAFAVINESEVARKYIRRYVIKAVAYFTDREDVESIQEILATGFVTKKNIDKMIEYAIDSKKPEIQLILMNYKNENFGFSDNFDRFIV